MEDLIGNFNLLLIIVSIFALVKPTLFNFRPLYGRRGRILLATISILILSLIPIVISNAIENLTYIPKIYDSDRNIFKKLDNAKASKDLLLLAETYNLNRVRINQLKEENYENSPDSVEHKKLLSILSAFANSEKDWEGFEKKLRADFEIISGVESKEALLNRVVFSRSGLELIFFGKPDVKQVQSLIESLKDNLQRYKIQEEKLTNEKAAQAEQEEKLANEKRLTISLSPRQIWINTDSTFSPATNLSSKDFENNADFYDGKIVKNWNFHISDVKSNNSIEIAFVDTFGNENIYFDLGKPVKSWGSLDKDNLRKNQQIIVRRAVLAKGIAGYYLNEAELTSSSNAGKTSMTNTKSNSDPSECKEIKAHSSSFADCKRKCEQNELYGEWCPCAKCYR